MESLDIGDKVVKFYFGIICPINENWEADWCLWNYVLPEYRRNHIGKKVAFLVFDMYPGNWEVEPIENSNEACRFWENVVINYTNNNYDFSDGIYVFKKYS